MRAPASDVGFSPAVKAVQTLQGSRATYARMEEGRGWATELNAGVTEFIARQTSFFIATASASGQPYVQHRGGPPGFLRVLDPTTLAFADFGGNRQYITVGNLTENDRVHLFLLDYSVRRRIKIWGTARVTDEPDVVGQLTHPDYDATVERGIVIRIHAWDPNCRQHIPRLLDAESVEQALLARDRRIASLENELAKLHAAAGAGAPIG